MAEYNYPTEDLLYDRVGDRWTRGDNGWHLYDMEPPYDLGFVLSRFGPLTTERPKRAWEVGDTLITEDDYREVRERYPDAVISRDAVTNVAQARRTTWQSSSGAVWQDDELADAGHAHIIRLEWDPQD